MRIILFCMLLLCMGSIEAGEIAATIVLDHANVYAGADSPALHDVSIVIIGRHIQNVAATKYHDTLSTTNARHIDLHGGWALPGLIDAHVHVYDKDALHRMLALGITTGRSMLTVNYEDVDLKALYEHGDADVPHLLAAGFPVVAHPLQFRRSIEALFNIYPDLSDLKTRDRIGADGARRIVIDNAKRPVDWIKVFANGRAGDPTSEPAARDLNDAELAAAVSEASKLGLPAAAHAFSDDGASAAVKAGVRTIEHGSLITEKTLTLMRDRHVCLVPTLSVIYAHATAALDAPEAERTLVPRMQMMLKGAHAAIAAARRIGVVVIAGTDTGYHADEPTVVDEIRHLADAGLSPAQALDAATRLSASCLGLEKRAGTIRAGLDADIVVYASNPTRNLDVLKSPTLVMAHGDIYLNTLAEK